MKLRFLLSVLVIAGAGCAKNDASGGFTAAQAQSAGKSLGAGVEDGTASFGPISAQGAGAAPSCVTLSGDTGDTDQDSIPNAATLTFACTSVAFGYTGTVTGTEMVTDSQPSAVAWAFAATADLTSTLTGPGGASITNVRSGSITGTQGSATGPFNLARNLDATTEFKNGQGTTLATVTEANAWDIGFTPQVTWTPGGAIVTGTVAVTGSWDVTVDNVAASATIATPTPLTLTPACATRVTAGTVTGTYADGARNSTITVTWTGCGASTVTLAAN